MRKIRVALLIVFVLLCGAFYFYFYSDYMEHELCWDHGGCWDYDANTCRTGIEGKRNCR